MHSAGRALMDTALRPYDLAQHSVMCLELAHVGDEESDFVRTLYIEGRP